MPVISESSMRIQFKVQFSSVEGSRREPRRHPSMGTPKGCFGADDKVVLASSRLSLNWSQLLSSEQGFKIQSLHTREALLPWSTTGSARRSGTLAIERLPHAPSSPRATVRPGT